MNIQFFIPGEPPTATAQQKGFNRKTGTWYKTPELKDAEAKYLAYANEVRPAEPFTGPVALTAIFGFRAGAGHEPDTPKTSKPDTDNMVKALKDALTRAGFWKDDAQVFMETTVKVWTDTPGVMVEVQDDGKDVQAWTGK